MNSNRSALVSADYATLEERVLSCLTLSEPTLRRQRVVHWRSSAFPLLQNLPREDTPGRSRHSAARSDSITGMRAQYVITDEMVYSNPGLNIIDEVLSEYKPEEVKPMQLEINDKAISMEWVDAANREGNVYYLTHGMDLTTLALHFGRHLEPGMTPQEVILTMYRTFWYSYIGPEVVTNKPYCLRGATQGLHWRALTKRANAEICKRLQTHPYKVIPEPIGALDSKGLVEVAQQLLLEQFQLTLHKDTVAFANEFFAGWENLCSKTAGDMSAWKELGLLNVDRVKTVQLLMSMNGIFANRGAIMVGEGFKDGNPMAILVQPVFRDSVLHSLKLQEQRMGRFLGSIFGTATDFRAAIDDLKVYNKKPQSYLCKTEEEWYNAYENGPRSCMTGCFFDYSPVRVYATTSHGLPDNNLRLCINYRGELFGKDFRVLNRAIVNIDTMEYVRAYGENGDAIMRSLDYVHDTAATDGAVLAKIPHPGYDGAYLMPYLDGSYDEVDDGGDHWVITCNGDYGATDASGYIHVHSGCTCNRCESRVDEGDGVDTEDDGFVCDECISEYYVEPVGREGYYHRSECTYSTQYDGYVHDNDAVECPVYGWVHCDDIYSAQGHRVHEGAVEWCDVIQDHILTEEAAAMLNEPYLGNENEEPAEDAA